MRKVVFICFYQGEQLRQRVKKVCDGYHASLYPCPESAAQRREMEVGVATRIHDLEFVIQQSEDHRRRLMQAAAKSLKNWFVCVRKVKVRPSIMNATMENTVKHSKILRNRVSVLVIDSFLLRPFRRNSYIMQSTPFNHNYIKQSDIEV